MNEYPKHILPAVGWRIGIKGFEILEFCESSMIGRRIQGTIDTCTESKLGIHNLKKEYLPSHRIINLSTNLLGAKFLYDDFTFRTKGDGSKNWDGKSSAESFLLEQNYEELKDEMFVVGWDVQELEKIEIPYKRKFDKKSNFDIFKEQMLETDEEIYIEEYEKLPIDDNKMRYVACNGEVRVNHAPTNLNYWHFTIDLYPMEDKINPLEDDKKRWSRDMAVLVGDILCKTIFIISNQSECPTISNWMSLVSKQNDEIV